ncbi:rhomboid family intramembrane serine protease GlpG [Morganella psychrotolerans]|uniref:rhomboid family intramembrane serine protease GlpG n=1 Tax=Morganella psychrotolerans TaxID=368603 RepID=UPI0039B0F378
MVYLITIANPRIAQSFIDYMASRDIHLVMRATREGSGVELWLDDESKLTETQAELESFMRDPMNKRYLAASWASGETDSPFRYPASYSAKNLITPAGPLTITITVLCALVYLWMQISGTDTVMDYLAWPDAGQQGELWRWVSPVFLHFSLTHILMNLALWWYLAGQVEKQMGSGRLFVITIVSALFSCWAQSLFSGSSFGGLSGVVFALIAYAWYTGVRNPSAGIYLPGAMMAFSVLWLVIGYFDLFGTMPIANMAHAAGLAIGLLMAVWDNRRPAA